MLDRLVMLVVALSDGPDCQCGNGLRHIEYVKVDRS